MSPSVVSKPAIARARKLRNDATDGERRLWLELRQFRRLYGIHVRRQAPIGPYVADFAVHAHELIIELDGEFHFTSEGIAKDAKRDAWLKQQGYRILHITTGELSENFDGCIEHILHALGLMK